MVTVPPLGRRVCVVNVTVVVEPVGCSAFWSPAASVSEADWTAARAGTEAPALPPSAEVRTVRPLPLKATPGPVVNSPAAKVILDVPTGKSAVAVVHTMVSVAAVNVQGDVRVAEDWLLGCDSKTTAGLDLALK